MEEVWFLCLMNLLFAILAISLIYYVDRPDSNFSLLLKPTRFFECLGIFKKLNDGIHSSSWHPRSATVFNSRRKLVFHLCILYFILHLSPSLIWTQAKLTFPLGLFPCNCPRQFLFGFYIATVNLEKCLFLQSSLSLCAVAGQKFICVQPNEL